MSGSIVVIERILPGNKNWQIYFRNGTLIIQQNDSRAQNAAKNPARRGIMAQPALSIPLFDADNHLYETRDALTKVPAGAVARLMNVAS
jgi:hypothetical protein